MIDLEREIKEKRNMASMNEKGCNSSVPDEKGTNSSVSDEKGSNGSIPDDLALVILSKFPLKSLKRFTYVKKSWLLLFNNPHFMSMFCRNFISNCHYGNDSSLLLKRIVDYFGRPNGPSYLDPCELIWISGDRFGEKVNLGQLSMVRPRLNGLFLHLFGFGSGIHGIICIYEPRTLNGSNVVLWNPTTGESLDVPPSPSKSNPPPFNYEVVECGFGYDEMTISLFNAYILGKRSSITYGRYIA
jgi:hypothetical protein